MRLSVVAVSFVLLFSPIAVAQHASGGGGSSGGGSSSGGSSSGSSGGASHGAGNSGSGSGSGGYSGGHVSGGASGSHNSGASGSAHVGTSAPSAYGFVHAPGKVVPLRESFTWGGGPTAFDSTFHGDSPEIRNPLLDQALAKFQFALPANLKNEQPISVKSLKRIENSPDRKAEPKKEVRKEDLDHKHCHGHNCKGRERIPYCTTGSNWRMSQDLYTTIQDDCGHLTASLAREESKASALQIRRDSACAINPGGSDCAAAYAAVYKSKAKIDQLHHRYDECVLHDLRRKAAVYVSKK